MNRFATYLERLESELPHIEVAELQEWKKLGRDFLLVDVRQPEEFAEGHVPGAINLPRPKIEANIEEQMRSPDQPVVVSCGGRGRSQLVCASLREMGIECVALRGGYQAWQLGLTSKSGE